MIKICFPPGCYGSYLSRCLYNYTNLRETEIDQFEFDNDGSSHSHRDSSKADSKIQIDHLNHNTTFTHSDLTVVIIPCDNHRLDYFNNQFIKQNQSQIVKYLNSILGKENIEYKLQQGWNYNNKLDELMPVWILREFIALWIADCFDDAYSVEQYQQVPHKISVTTQNIFLDLLDTIFKICQTVGLTVEVDDTTILKNHLKFTNAQKYYQSQIQCEQWCHDVIQGNSSLNPCKTIFDEAYIQYYLDTQGFKIQCDGLNTLPTISNELTKIIYKS
jgi:hypothetical protein